jgi:octaprenyl-diphosphate synthase
VTRAHDLNLDQETYPRIISAKTANCSPPPPDPGAVEHRRDEKTTSAVQSVG